MSGFRSTAARDGYRLEVQASNKTLSTPDEAQIWEGRINNLGGTITGTELGYARNIVDALAASTFNAKILYLLPFIGGSIAAHRVPLRDTLGIGAASNTGFVDADCTTAGGIANPTEAAKYLDTQIKANQLGISNNGGLGFWERAWGAGSNVEPIGAYGSTSVPDQRFVIDLRNNVQAMRWGAPANVGGNTSTAISAHYYGQRSSATLRRLYRNGAQIGTDGTTSDTASRAGERNLWVMGCNSYSGPRYWKGRCAVAYFTDGSLTDTEVADLHTLLSTYLVSPTGR